MILIPLADLRITLDQIVSTEFIANEAALVRVRVNGELVDRVVSGSEHDAYMNKVIELTGDFPSKN